jgi:hypothetical protein
MNGKIKYILKEFSGVELVSDSEEDLDYTKDNIFPEKFYERVFKLLDKNPERMFKTIEDLQFGENFDGDYDQYQKEYNIAYKYLSEYENRTPFYITFEYDKNTLSEFFKYDRDYDIQKMVGGYFGNDYDYSHYYDCMDTDSWLIDKINQENMGTLKSKYLQDLQGEENVGEDFQEYIISEYGSEIGCSASEAQNSADIDYLHSDFEEGVMEYLSNLNGKLVRDDKGEIKFVGSLEIGELVNSEWFQDVVEDALYSYYPDLIDVFASIKEKEQDGWSGQYNYFFPDDLIQINTDKHFRYGGAGDIDWGYFNEILSDRLNY